MDIHTNRSNELNGKHGPVNGQAPAHREKPKQRSARSFLHGRTATFIVPLQTAWGEVEFRVRQARLGLNGELSDLLREEDLWDAMRGLNDARRWIKTRQRAYWWKGLVAGLL